MFCICLNKVIKAYPNRFIKPKISMGSPMKTQPNSTINIPPKNNTVPNIFFLFQKNVIAFLNPMIKPKPIRKAS